MNSMNDGVVLVKLESMCDRLYGIKFSHELFRLFIFKHWSCEHDRSSLPALLCLIPSLTGAHGLPSFSRPIIYTNNGLGGLIHCCSWCWDELCTLVGLFTE